VTLYFAAHLAASFVWNQGNESLLGCVGNLNYVNPFPATMPDPTAYGTDAYSGGAICTKGDNAGDWTTPFFGVGTATGSSRNFKMFNQSDGPSGAITLPIPTVEAPSHHITITKVTVPASSGSDVFGYSGNLGSFNLDTNGGDGTNPSTKTFNDIAAGPEYIVDESTIPSGWTLDNLTCSITSGVDPGIILNFSTATGEAHITISADADGPGSDGITVTCTYTNIGTGNIIVVKQTDPDGSTASFEFNPSWSGSNFNLTDGQQNDSGDLAPGTYGVSELAKAGWDLTTSNCNGGTPAGTDTLNLT
jgi:hypothetical protein